MCYKHSSPNWSIQCTKFFGDRHTPDANLVLVPTIKKQSLLTLNLSQGVHKATPDDNDKLSPPTMEEVCKNYVPGAQPRNNLGNHQPPRKERKLSILAAILTRGLSSQPWKRRLRKCSLKWLNLFCYRDDFHQGTMIAEGSIYFI